jgi:hypothetical protein
MQAKDYCRTEYIVHEFISLRLISPRMDPERFAQLLSQWLQSQTGSLPGVLALDGFVVGKYVASIRVLERLMKSPVASIIGQLLQKN